MAKLRRNHNQNKQGYSFMVRILTTIIVLTISAYAVYENFIKNTDALDTLFEEPSDSATANEGDNTGDDLLPISNTGQVVHHTYYSLSYDEKHEQAEWVAYRLTESSLRKPNVKRTNRYNPDYAVSTRSAFHRDYSNSGFTRGHLAPAGDMAFNETAMKESFFMSNMSPQKRSFNNGIWKELEEQVRDWAFHNDEIYVVTGPVLNGETLNGNIGKQNKVSIPSLFYKVIYDYKKPEEKMIAFVMPNDVSRDRLSEYAVTVDSVEELTGIDFFKGGLLERKEEKLESSINIRDWKFSEKRYQLRINKWNQQ